MPSPEALAVIQLFRSPQPDPDAAALSYAEQREQSGQMIASMAPMPADAKTETLTVAGVAALRALRARGLPQPAAAVALSPWADLTHSGETITTKAEEEPVLSLDTLRLWAGLYAGDSDLADPMISPLNADLSGLSPLLIQVGTAEVLLSDAERVQAAGGAVEYQPEQGLFHCYQLFPLYPEAQEAVGRIGQFITQHTGN